MLAERNENKKAGGVVSSKHFPSPKRLQKNLKENFLQFNTKDLLLRSSKLQNSEPPTPTDDFFMLETNKIKTDFLKRIMSNELAKGAETFRDDFLRNHRLTSEIRARMVN